MKHMTMRGKGFPLNLQLFAEDTGSSGADGAGSGEGDGEPGEGEPGEDPEAKKFSQKDMDDTVAKLLAKERRKWQREQQKAATVPVMGAKGAAGDPTGPEAESEADKKVHEAEARAAAVEMKWACLEHGVRRDSVDDVLALAKVHMEKDKGMDIEDAVDAVLKKYPQFHEDYESGSQEDKKGWGQRHGQAAKGTTTVEDEIRKQLFGK